MNRIGMGSIAGGRKPPLEFVRQYSVILTLVIIVIVSAISTRGLFLSPENLLNIGERASIVGIVAIGQMLVIITGGIDLSIGSIMAIAFTVISKLILELGVPVPLAIMVTLFVGAFVGMINGLLVAKTRVPPFMITLGTMLFFFYLALLITGSKQLYYEQIQLYFNGVFKLDAYGARFFPTATWLIISIAMIAVLQRTRFGQNIYAVGGKELAARLSGIRADNVKIIVYTLSGLMCAIAAVVYGYRLKAANPDAGMKLQLESIAAVIVGGTNVLGGEGTVYGTFVGAIIMASLVNLLNLLNVDPFIQDAFKGLLLLVFVYIMQLLSKRR